MAKMTKKQILEARASGLEQTLQILRHHGIDELPAEYFTTEAELENVLFQLEELTGPTLQEVAEMAKEQAPKKAIHEDAKETAKKIRKELKKAFPETKFAVTSKTYSMGSNVNVRYSGQGVEPDHEKVSELCNKFKSVNFDGMTDYADLVGYEYQGEIYYGADYIFYSRR